ncbi:MAG TPA: hypothetical protein VHO69_03120, partial [Phototrophicaceae bacterium]|nr:hypothetical protein [Phototrophicaceae bacterium]
MSKLITMKFGGTSVGSAEAIANVVSIVTNDTSAGNRVIVVVSAMSGVTDTLLASIKMAISGNKWGYLDTAQKLRDRHIETLNLLVPPGKNRETARTEINALLDEYAEICQAVSILGEATPRIRDAIVAFGERMSSRLVAAALRHYEVD